MVLQIPSPFRSHANKRVEVNVMLDGAVEIFYKTEKIATFDSKTTHTIGLYRTNAKKRGSAKVPFLGWHLNPSSHLDIFTSLLT